MTTPTTNSRGQQGNRDDQGNFVVEYSGSAFPELIKEAAAMSMEELTALEGQLSAKLSEGEDWQVEEKLRIVKEAISKLTEGDEEELPDVNLDVNF